jgi:hypothetical protein
MLFQPPSGARHLVVGESASPNALGLQAVNVTSATANVKTAWTVLAAAGAVPFDVFGITLILGSLSSSAVIPQALVDIAYGPAGSEIIIASNIVCGSNGGWSSSPMMYLPLFIPAGSRIVYRMQANSTSRSCRPSYWFHGAKGSPLGPVFTRAESIGVDTATSGGLPFTCGVSGARGSWASFAATTREYGAILPSYQCGDANWTAANTFYAEIGIGSVAISPPAWFSVSTTRTLSGQGPGQPTWGPFPAGTVFQVRGEASSAVANVLQCGLLGFY